MQSTPTCIRCKNGDKEIGFSTEVMKKNQNIGMPRGWNNTKIHTLVDGLGNPIRLIFTSGEVHDSKQGLVLLEVSTLLVVQVQF